MCKSKHKIDRQGTKDVPVVPDTSTVFTTVTLCLFQNYYKIPKTGLYRTAIRTRVSIDTNNTGEPCYDKRFLQVECAEFSEGLAGGFVGKKNAASYAMRMFEARESAADLAVGLEAKVQLHSEERIHVCCLWSLHRALHSLLGSVTYSFFCFVSIPPL